MASRPLSTAAKVVVIADSGPFGAVAGSAFADDTRTSLNIFGTW